MTMLILRAEGVTQPEDAAVAKRRMPKITKVMPKKTTKVTTTAVGKTRAKMPTASATMPRMISIVRYAPELAC